MILKSVRIDELKRIIVKNINRLDKNRFWNKCLIQLETYVPVLKDIENSNEAKAEAIRLYSQKNLSFTQLYEILIIFNKSIAYAPKDSKELAIAYANKSAVLLRMRKYTECISEIDNALKITESVALKVKMLCRKAECLTALGSTDNRGFLEKAKFIVVKSEDLEEAKLLHDTWIKRTQLILDEGKLDIPKEDKRVIQGLEMIEEVERKDLSESIRVEYSEVYGWHLVAARDYKPGEIILVEKPYFNTVDDSLAFQYCDHCHANLWTVVPCDHCSRYMYCSEDCKNQAWNEYHDLECYALAFMRVAFERKWNKYIPFVVRLFCKALKEAGNIEQLVIDTEASDQNQDQNSSDAPSSLSFTSYKSVFTLPAALEPHSFKVFSELCIIILMGLAKYTKIFGKTYQLVEMKKLTKDHTAIIIGALLLKFMIVLDVGIFLGPLIDLGKDSEDLEESKNKSNEESDEEPEKGSNRRRSYRNPSLLTLMAHIAGGCIQNVRNYPTHGNRNILCAMQPIRAGEKLLKGHGRGHGSSGLWTTTSEDIRQFEHTRRYGCLCECQACTENWTDILEDRDQIKGILEAEAHCPSIAKLRDERDSIVSYWGDNCLKASFPDIKMLHRIQDLLETAFEQLPMTSLLLERLVWLLSLILEAFFNRSEIFAKVPDLRINWMR